MVLTVMIKELPLVKCVKQAASAKMGLRQFVKQDSMLQKVVPNVLVVKQEHSQLLTLVYVLTVELATSVMKLLRLLAE